MAEETNPVDFLPSHSPRTELEQLTAALNAGLITPELFALAKEKLLHPAVPVTEILPPSASEPTADKHLGAAEKPEATAAEATMEDLPPLASFFKEAPPTVPELPVRQIAPTIGVSLPASIPSRPVAAKVAVPRVEPDSRPVITPVPLAAAVPPNAYDALLDGPVSQPPVSAKPGTTPAAADKSPASPKWLKIGLVLAILGLLALIYRQVAGSHPDERLTTPHAPSTASPPPKAARVQRYSHRTAKPPKPQKYKALKTSTALSKTPAKTAALPRKAAPLDKLGKPAALPTPAVSSQPAAAPSQPAVPPEPDPTPIPARAEATDTKEASRVRDVMAAYYADMLAPPFHADRYFAPHVERLYIQQNLTPADITANFERSFFPDNKQAVLQIEPGTLRLSMAAADGSRVATFTEASRVYHPSRRGYQRLRAQVRVRFDADYHIVYLRQERLLENAFE